MYDRLKIVTNVHSLMTSAVLSNTPGNMHVYIVLSNFKLLHPQK